MDEMMALPEEMRIKIFNMIPQENTINTRLVCKAWNQEIQDNYEYCVDLDEYSQHFQIVLQLRIKELRVQQLETTPVMNQNGTSIFSHPNAVRELRVGGDDYEVSPINLHRMLGLFGENLSELYIDVDPEICNHQFPSGLSLNFKQLNLLDIYSNGGNRFIDNNQFDRCEDNPQSIFQVIENSMFPKLKVLRVDLHFLKMTTTALTRILANVHQILSKHGKFLEVLSIWTDKLEHLIDPTDQELLQIKQIKTLERVIMIMPSVSSRMHRFWNEFIYNQTKLKNLYMSRRSPIFPVSVVQQIVFNNYATLETLHIIGLCIPPTDPPFDLSILQNCSCLNTLRLEQSDVRPNPAEPDVINFHHLPENIQTLIFTKFKILSEEVLMAFQENNPLNKTKGFPKLNELRLVGCGDQGVFGINTACLHEIMMIPRPNLMNVDFRFGGIHERDESMEAVLGQLGLLDDRDFIVRRNYNNVVWRYYQM